MLSTLRPPKSKPEVFYPESDGEPLAETDLHAQETIALFQSLKHYFWEHDFVYVAMDNFLYYEEGNPSAVVSPDVYVVFGVRKGLRDMFKTWEEDGHVPNTVFEITSKNTRRIDFGRKKLQYERLGVPEYFLFDPLNEYLDPPLQGFVLKKGAYVPMAAEQDGALLSKELGLRFFVDKEMLLQIVDSGTGSNLPRPEHFSRALNDAGRAKLSAEMKLTTEMLGRWEAEQALKRESEARRSAEAEIARLKKEIKRLKK